MEQLLIMYLLASLFLTICYEVKMEVIKEQRKYSNEDEIYYLFGKDEKKYFDCMYFFFPSIILVKVFTFITQTTKTKL